MISSTFDSVHFSKVPICNNVRDFMSSAREEQTLLFHLGHGSERRILNLEDKDILGGFVDILCGKIFNGSSLLKDKILKESKAFGFDNEVHFGVVWVFYFDYVEQSMKSIPVFKVYKKKKGNAAVYLTIQAWKFNSWDEFIDQGGFSSSLLCFPRHGEYVLDKASKMLDLEYVTSKPIKKICFSVNSPCTILRQTIREFPTLVKKWMIKLSASGILESVLKGVILAAYVVFCSNNSWELSYNLFSALVFLVQSPIFSRNKMKEVCQPSEMIVSGCEIFNESNRLIGLLRSPKPNITEILFCFSNCYTHGRLFLKAILNEIKYGNVLPELMKLLYKLLNSISNRVDVSCCDSLHFSRKEIKFDTLVKSFIKSGKLSVSKVETTKVKNECEASLNDGEDVEKIVSEYYEKSLKNLSLLSSGTIQNVEEDVWQASEIWKKKLENLQEGSCSLLVGECPGYNVYLFRDSQHLSLVQGLTEILGKLFYLSFGGKYCTVLDEEKNTIGRLYFPDTCLAFGVLNSNAIN